MMRSRRRAAIGKGKVCNSGTRHCIPPGWSYAYRVASESYKVFCRIDACQGQEKNIVRVCLVPMIRNKAAGPIVHLDPSSAI